MDLNPLNILSDFLNRPNKPPSYSLLYNKPSGNPKRHTINYIDSIVNDNNFISTYSKAYKIKKQAKCIEAVSLIQKWFKKFKCKLEINKENNTSNVKKEEKIVQKLIRNQAAKKIQQFVRNKIKKEGNANKEKNGNPLNMQNNKKTIETKNNRFLRDEIKTLMTQVYEENLEDLFVDYSEFDSQIMRKVTNYFFYQNNRLKQENEYIKLNLYKFSLKIFSFCYVFF